MRIYLDILLITNFVSAFVMLMLVAHLIHIKVGWLSAVLASVICSVSSLTIAADITAFTSILIKIIAVMSASAIVLKSVNYKRVLRFAFIFTAMNLMYIAVIYVVWTVTKSGFIYVCNCTIYFDVSLLLLIVATVITYVIMCVFDYIRTVKFNRNTAYRVTICVKSKSFTLSAIADTGNGLLEAFTGKPVIICHSGSIYSKMGLDSDNLEYGFRLLPFNTVAGSGMVKITTPESIVITDDSGFSKNVSASVGFLDTDDDSSNVAVFNPIILE